ncbi:MAG: glycosyltransferase family 4 protein [Rhizobiaceae bacterium]
MENAGFDVRRLDGAGNAAFDSDLPSSNARNSYDQRNLDPGVLLLHANPPQIPYLFLTLGKRFIAQKYVIGYSVWELPKIPADWRQNLRFVHRVWCPSEFSAQAFRSETDKLVQVVPHAIEPDSATKPNRGKFGISSGALVVLNALHLGSGLTRKNPLAAIRAFKSAFGGSDRALLLVKVSQSEFYPDRLRRIEDEIAGAPNIRVLTATLSDRDYWTLLHSIDAVLSPHRSEGFGLVTAQAMAVGKVAIATGWSGNMEYMTPENSLLLDYRLVSVQDPEGNYQTDGQEWAEPDTEHAAQPLRRVAFDNAMRQRIGTAAARSVRSRLSRKVVTQKICDRLAELGVRPSLDRRKI